jgi:hypothetical protein
MAYVGTRRKVFISHYKGDKLEVEEFIQAFAKRDAVFVPRILGANENYDLIDSSNTAYVMSQIRKKYLEDSTVTIVLIGACTHSRRYVDWEIKSSLTQGEQTPNGLIGLLLPSMGSSAHLPPRLKDNWNSDSKECYARYYSYPKDSQTLGAWIEDAFEARTNRAKFIVNTQDMMKYNAKCRVHDETH